MFKEIFFNEEARSGILAGVNILAKAVGSTLGPKGVNCIFEESSFPTITKDGVTVAQQIFLEDKLNNMGVMICREAAENTNREAGDGTTTTVVLLQQMVNEADKYITRGMNPILIKRGMNKALELVLKSLEKQIRKIKTEKERLQIAIISSNNDEEVGKMIVEVIKKIGKEGIVTVQNSNSLRTEVDYVKGTKVDHGYESSVFINNPKRLTVEIENPLIIVSSDKIHSQDQLLPLMQRLVSENHRKMVLFAETIEDSAMAFLIQNHLLGKFSCVPIKLPSFGNYQHDLIYDLAALTNATVIGDEAALKMIDADKGSCGTCENIIIGRDGTIIVGAKGKIKLRIEEIRTLLVEEKDIFKKSKLEERLGKLNGSVANIKVGGASETDQSEVKYRIEDALNATKSAIQEGVVEGGGMALLKCFKELRNIKSENEEELAGMHIVINALRKPLEVIVGNSGKNGQAIADKVLDTGKGYDALNDTFGNLYELGIIDPFRVVKFELINSVSTAGILITSGSAITVVPEIKK